MWTNLCNVIGRPEMATDERFKDRRSRLHHIEELTAAINAWTTQHTKHEVMRILGEADVPCGKVLDSVELLNDPHLRERGMIVTVQHPVRGEFTMPGCPVKLEDSPVEVQSAPLLGEHNNEVFAQYLGIRHRRDRTPQTGRRNLDGGFSPPRRGFDARHVSSAIYASARRQMAGAVRGGAAVVCAERRRRTLPSAARNRASEPCHRHKP